MKNIILALAALFVSANITLADYKPKVAKPEDNWYTAKLTITSERGTGYGTGTPIACEKGKTFILTNAHAVENKDQTVTVKIAGNSYPATYIFGSNVRHTSETTITIDGPDLAVISINAELDYVRFALRSPPANARVWQKGFSAGAETPTYKSGHVARDEIFAVPTLKSTIAAIGGDSGSAVFNDDGELVAVCWGGNGSIELAVDIVLVHDFILTNKFEKHFPDCTLRLEVRKAISTTPTPRVCPNGRCPLQRARP